MDKIKLKAIDYKEFKNRVYRSPFRFLMEIGSAPFPSSLLRSSYKNFESLVKTMDSQPIILNLGSRGERTTSAMRYLEGLNLINLDIERFDGVDIVCDGHFLPFKEGSVHGVIVDGVLEHVKRPAHVADEILRVLRNGGYVYAKVPFVMGFHARPCDFQRYTLPGLIYLFHKFTIIDSGVAKGPSAAFHYILSDYLATLFSFGKESVYAVLKDIFALFMAWVKLLDIPILKLAKRSKLLEIMPQDFFVIGEKSAYIIEI